MLKGISVKICIIMASILVLAHAVVPHLHFKNEVFIITPACNADKNHKHNAPEHKNEAETNRNFCLLKQVVLVRFNDSDAEICNPVLSDENGFNGSLFAIIITKSFHFYVEPNVCPPTSFNPFFYTHLVDCSINSRGSPIV